MIDDHNDAAGGRRAPRYRVSDRTLIAAIVLAILGAAAFMFWPVQAESGDPAAVPSGSTTADGGQSSTSDSRDDGNSRAAPATRDLPAVQQDLPAPVAAVHTGGDAPSTLQVAGRTIPIDTITTDASGTLNPPQDIARVGWWVNSGLPGGGSGSVVVTGHINDESGNGAAQGWTKVVNGDEIVLLDSSGNTLRYSVTTNNFYNKSTAFPVDVVNKMDGPETLVLVTCGGEFVGGALGYEDNQVVTAARI